MATLPGSPAPDFKLQNQNEEWVSLTEQLSRGPVMLAFYPGDFTPVCTKQLCAYQNAFDRFVNYGINVLGVSPNPPESHQRFKSQYKFTFDLLSDPKKEVIKQYGVTSLFMLGGMSRAVFIISKSGKIVYRYIEPTSLTHRKPDELLGILDELRRSGQI